jgi:lipopolysaccharide transport system ATP-binding protein
LLFVSHQMQAVSSLCTRAMQLAGGSIVDEGSAEDVVARYLHTVGGTGSEVSWPDLESAPGDDVVRLRSARVVLEDGSTVDSLDVREPVGIEIAFTVLRRDQLPLFPKLKIMDGQGHIAFNALDASSRWHEPVDPGEYVSTAWIPANFLNEGYTTVEVAVCAPGTVSHYPRASKYGALAFHVYDPAEGDSAKGLFAGVFKGAVRPLLEWTTEER